MARRMFSTDIVGSDAFIEMPSSSQNLYFHLGMYADDDGFVSPVKVIRLISASNDDLKVLISKRFVLPFESGVVVIKHWLNQNLIRADLYKETLYKKEKSSLGLNENGAYTEFFPGRENVTELKKVAAPKWLTLRRKSQYRQRAVNGPKTALSIGKVSKVKYSKKNILSNKLDEEYNFDFQLSKMFADKEDRRMPIIAYYWKIKGWIFDNKDLYDSALKRELRPAGLLKGYTNEKIKQTCEWLKANADFKWTMETIHKYIDEPLETLKGGGKQKTEDDLIKELQQKYVHN